VLSEYGTVVSDATKAGLLENGFRGPKPLKPGKWYVVDMNTGEILQKKLLHRVVSFLFGVSYRAIKNQQAPCQLTFCAISRSVELSKISCSTDLKKSSVTSS